MTTQISTIQFHNQSLVTFEQNGMYYTAMKPICENIGLDWTAQAQRLKRDDVLNSTMVVITIVAEDGKNREMICLPIDYLNGWLFGIDVKRVKPEIRETLIMYKKECYKALADYWFKGKAERSQNPQPNLPLVEPPKMFKRELTEKEMQDLCWAWYALRNYIELTDTLQKQFGGFGGDYAYAIRQLNERYRNLPQEILPVLQRITTEFKPDNIHGNGWNRILHSVQYPNTLFRVGRLIHLF